MSESLWLSYLLFSCPYRLTSKDKLVASYLYFASTDITVAHFISITAKQSGLAERTVQKSFARLVGIKAVEIRPNTTFVKRGF